MSGDDYSDFMPKDLDKPFSTRLVERCKAQPFFMAGWAGTIGALIYGAYRYKTRGPSIEASIFIVQLRVLAQGMIVGSLSLGMIYQTYLNHVKNKESKLEVNKD